MTKQEKITTTGEDMMANAIRVLAMDTIQAANSGHPGAPMGLADVATVLFNRFTIIDPSADRWPDRDCFVMSAGHGSMLVYTINHFLGCDDMDMDQIRNFRQFGYNTAGHPEYGHAKGIECATGPLGQGISMGVGMALAERMHNARFGNELVDYYTYAIAGDGCLMEGISHEVIDFAGHNELGQLIVLWDDNRITIDGSTDVSTSTDQNARFAAAGWYVTWVDGHNKEAIAAAIEGARVDDRPLMIACSTIIGYGSPNKQGTAATHGAPLGNDEITLTCAALGWDAAPFDIPADIYADWHAVAARGKSARNAWDARLAAGAKTREFKTSPSGNDTAKLGDAITAFRAELSKDAPKVATRKASQTALEVVNATLPNTVGGSADLTGSNLTKTSDMKAVTRDDYTGDYVNYGVREHVMGAIMNGIALHGGFLTYGGTFLVFAEC